MTQLTEVLRPGSKLGQVRSYFEAPPVAPPPLTFDKYTEEANKTNLCPSLFAYDDVPIYEVLAMCGEAGETANKVKKVMRDLPAGVFPGAERTEIALELGDTLWYIDAAARKMGYTLAEIAQMNIKKLHARAEAGTLHGSGDHR